MEKEVAVRAVLLALAMVVPAAPSFAVDWPSDAEPGVRFQVTFGPNQPVTPRLLLRVDYVAANSGKPALEAAEADSPAAVAFAQPTDSAVRVPLEWRVGSEGAKPFEVNGVKLQDEASTDPDPWVWAAGAGLAAVFAVTAAHQPPAESLDRPANTR